MCRSICALGPLFRQIECIETSFDGFHDLGDVDMTFMLDLDEGPHARLALSQSAIVPYPW